MGGGDLNLKKSWHPNTAKNQEKVWKAEQIDAAEKRKLAELQKEISDERNREELKKIGQTSGVLSINDDKKLEWMYKGSTELVNREEYLLGRTIDKNYEQLDAIEKDQKTGNVLVPKNHVEHECIPFSIRQFKGSQLSSEQVDLTRKLMEDPVMAIKQKEMETRRKILENPVKLKELHRLLKHDKGSKTKKSKKSSKKSKKNKKKKHLDSDSGSSNISNDEDLDKILAKKYKKIQGVINQEDEDDKNLDLNQLLSMKYDKLSKELDKITKKHKKKRRSSSSSATPDYNDCDDNRSRRRRSVERRGIPDRRQVRRDNRPRSPVRDYRNDSRSNYYRADNKQRQRSPSPRNSRYNRNRSKSRSRERKPAATRKQTPSPESSSEVSTSSAESDNDDNPTKKFGLISADGKQMKLGKLTDAQKAALKPAKHFKPKWTKPDKKNILTEEEKDRKRREMLSNAEWRDEERVRNVRRYRDEENREKEAHSKDFDRDFITRQLNKAARSETVESRIKSNINNIQRSGNSMNSNFARR